jgi:hypothetical protein
LCVATVLKGTVALTLWRARLAAVELAHPLSPHCWTTARLNRPVAGLAERGIGQQRWQAVHGIGVRFLHLPLLS